MTIQRKLGVSTQIVGHDSAKSAEKRLKEQGGWRVTDITIGYLSDEAKIGSTVTFAIGYTNLTDKDVTLQFPTNQRVAIRIFDAAGTLVYESPAGTGPQGAESIASSEGRYWTTSVDLDNGSYQAGSYTVIGALMCLPGASAAIALDVL